MKSILALVLAASAVSVNANYFYDEGRNQTCSHGADGFFKCESGHLHDAPHLAEVVGSMTKRDESALQKRVSCSFTVGGVGACPVHCYTDGYCNSYCDPKSGICHCTCLDQTGTCSRTSCSPP